MLKRDFIKQMASAAGFDLCGVARCRPLAEQVSRVEGWLAAGRHGGMGYMERNFENRFDPARLVEGARTVVVCAVSYNHGLHTIVEENYAAHKIPKIASYAFARDYHEVIKGMLARVLGKLQETEPSLTGRCFVDTAPLLEKSWAVEAGLGWIGRNSLLVNPSFGSFLLLGEIVMDSDVDDYDTPFAAQNCGECRRCVERCPNAAIGPDRMIDTRRCISRLTIEKIAARENTPGPSSEMLHGWIYGCDACQSACPYNKHPLPSSFPGLAPAIDPAALPTDYWTNLTEEEFETVFGSTPLTRCGLERIKAHLRG